MEPKKVLKVFSGVCILLIVVTLIGSWFKLNGYLIFPFNPQGSYTEKLGEYSIDEIIPTFEFVEVWNSEVESQKGFDEKYKYSKEDSEKIFRDLMKIKYRGLTKKEKIEKFGKQFPDDSSMAINIYSFYSSLGSGNSLYGPDLIKRGYLEGGVPEEEKRDILGFYLIQERKTGEQFLEVVYYNYEEASEKKSNTVSFFKLTEEIKLPK